MVEFEAFLDKFEGFIGTNFWTMIFAWINIFILYLILKKLLFKPVKNMIDSRQKEVDDMLKDAEDAKTNAEAMEAEYKEKLEAANVESEEIVKNAIRKAQLKEEEILKEADNAAAKKLERAEEQIAMEKKQALCDVKDEVADIALSIAAQVIERDVSEEEHKQLIDDFIDKLGEN